MVAPPRASRGWRRAALTIGAVLGVVGGGAAAPAVAVGDSILLSTDGVHFSTEINGGIFDDLGALVPGDSVASELWIKNPTSAPAMLRISTRNVSISSAEFADGVTMSSWDSKTGATTTLDLRDMAECAVLAPAQQLEAGESIKTVLRFTMSDLDRGAAMNGGVGLDLMVAMRDAPAGAFTASACEDDGVLISSTPAPSGALPTTGALPITGTDPVAPLIAGGLLLGIGAYLLRRSGPRGAAQS